MKAAKKTKHPNLVSHPKHGSKQEPEAKEATKI